MKYEEIIVDYLKAYEAFNGSERLPTIVYKNGFFLFQHKNGAVTRYRRGTLERMTATLGTLQSGKRP